MEPRAWKRDKARQLFQLLLSERGRALHRDEIVERLWPEREAEAALRDFKVALTALNKALEPEPRPRRAPAPTCVREGSAYRLSPQADLWLDLTPSRRPGEAGLRRAQRGRRPRGRYPSSGAP